MKRSSIAIIILLSILFKPAPSYSGPFEMVIDNLPLFLPGFVLIVAISCAYYQNQEYKKIIKRVNSSLSQYPKMGRMAVNFIFAIVENADSIIPNFYPFNNIDIIGIKSAAKKVSNDIAFNDNKELKSEEDATCDPPEGTICYDEPDYGKPHGGLTPHYHLYQMQKKRPSNTCFWRYLGGKVGVGVVGTQPEGTKQCSSYSNFSGRPAR